MRTKVIEARNLTKSYGNVTALKGISFYILEGECFGFLGHNGAGKSTIMRMIYGLAQTGAGELDILGERIRLTPPHIKARLGVVPQDDNLDPELSVADNLMIYARYYGLHQEEAARRSGELLDFMGLTEKAGEKIEELSGGLKRRLVIARALINRPQIVILDEPTTGLDPQARRLVWQKLRILKQEGTTLILTTHYMEEAEQLCDRAVIMNQGEILAEGSPEHLIAGHVRRDVIEVHAELGTAREKSALLLERMGAEWFQTENVSFIFAADGKYIWDNLNKLGIPQHVCLLRKARLEDVYLKLAGRPES